MANKKDYKDAYRILLNRVIDISGAIIGWREKLFFNSETEVIKVLEEMVDRAVDEAPKI